MQKYNKICIIQKKVVNLRPNWVNMKKQIPIFIAGAKSFREQRVALKAMANDLNKEFIDQKKDVVLHMCSYENFGDHQQEYNQFIAEVADLVIFVLDGKIGTHTEEEFRLAVAEFKKDRVPKVYVFLKEFTEHTEDIKKIEGLLEEAFGPNFYYIAYKTDEELCTKAKERIQQYVNQYQHRISLIRRAIGAGVVVLLILASFFTAFVVNKVNHHEPEPMLVFVGGGSAASYLDSVYHYDVVQNTKEQQSLFINMPSRDSYSLLTDWILERPNISDMGKGNNFFYPISLSASRANEKDFIKDLQSREDFMEYGVVLEYFMGYDTLSVLVHDPVSVQNEETITIGALKEMLMNNDMVYLTTRDNSGTYTTYLNLLDSMFTKEKDKMKATRQIFYKENSIYKIEEGVGKDKGYVVLGSYFYQPSDCDAYCKISKNNYNKRYLVDDAGNVMRKAMFIYIPIPKYDGIHCKLPDIAKRFIRNVDDTLTYSLDVIPKQTIIYRIDNKPEER